ncbi:MAG: SPFH/Band 7/PHB domain protein [Deltaproteobacteria bacterium]|jgi:regulator of protease activity HflC (stomatin/prohibitin superfamily)|nr:SPFH/Band 7/PHB domain protein [Deltaproteobacteria bacterium]MCW8892253.1 SPFH/Band 7/PHB domain protein [Deltaproteobacteria bacterium]MCW9049573.1 SPFH/Band 7/PHB domain protein [Deltaproteobacteria bacterium]
MEGLIGVLILAILVIVTISLGIRIVPQGTKYVVQRLGKFHTTLSPGLNIIIPYIDSVSHKVTTKDIVLDVPSQEVITKDNAVVRINAITYMSIISPEKAVYGVDNYQYAIQNLVQTSLRSIVGEMALDEVLSSRELIKTRLKAAISDDVADWGVIVKNTEVQEIAPSETMQQAMERQAAAERERRATVTKAEGAKTAAILEADGRKQSAKLDGEAKILLAQATEEATKRINSAIAGGNNTAIMYLLGERYVDAIREISTSENSKTILLPADLPAAVRGLMGGLGMK